MRLYEVQYKKYLKRSGNMPLPMSYEEWLENRLELHVEGILSLETAMIHNEEQLDKRWNAIVKKAKADSNNAPQLIEEPKVKGGFLAARGIFADTWDGEPAEVTIRRLRDAE